MPVTHPGEPGEKTEVQCEEHLRAKIAGSAFLDTLGMGIYYQ